MSADLATPIRAALIGSSSITSSLAAYKGSFPIFTRRPAPPDAIYPMIMISPTVTTNEEDGLTDQRPVLERDIAIYGQNDTPAKYVVVEALALAVFNLFHRRRTAITVTGWYVVGITARGPLPAPVDDDQNVGRVVPLTIRLARLV